MLDIGVDVGGTFTDVTCIKDRSLAVALKVPSTRPDLHRGVLEGVDRALIETQSQPADVSRIIHGTTVATNAIIEHRGAVVGILMTEGFEDTLELGRYKRSSNYDVWFDAETPVFLAPRRRRKGVRERIDHNGNVLQPLDEGSVKEVLKALVEEQAVQAVAVCYLFSFVNPSHEKRTAEIAQALYPDLAVSLSCQVNPEVREYERLCVTAFDAYVRPVMSQYLDDLRMGLGEMGIAAPLQVMESSGGICSVELAVERPSRTIMSGPAAGVKGALYAADRSGYRDVISIDIGGTSSDVSLGASGRPVTSREGKVLTYPVRVPMIDVTSIGAGGGSIAWFDVGGSLRVGPQSAGADPGPACYGRGGEEATVTDASVVLGYVNPDYFAGGTLVLQAERAHVAVASVAARLGTTSMEAAWGIHEIVNASMADQIRLVSVGRGYDPRKFGLVLLGGAGAVHGCAIAEDLGIQTLIVPRTPGVLSAFGLLVSDVEYEQTLTFQATVDDGGVADAQFQDSVRSALRRLEAEGDIAMRRQTIEGGDVEIRRSVDMRYVGQSYELEIPCEFQSDCLPTEALTHAFDVKHREVYGHSRATEPKEIVNLRTVHIARVSEPAISSWSGSGARSEQTRVSGSRQVFFGAHGVRQTPVYDRAQLSPREEIDGPAVVEQEDTTVVIRPGWHARVDQSMQLVLRKR